MKTIHQHKNSTSLTLALDVADEGFFRKAVISGLLNHMWREPDPSAIIKLKQTGYFSHKGVPFPEGSLFFLDGFDEKNRSVQRVFKVSGCKLVSAEWGGTAKYFETTESAYSYGSKGCSKTQPWRVKVPEVEMQLLAAVVAKAKHHSVPPIGQDYDFGAIQLTLFPGQRLRLVEENGHIHTASSCDGRLFYAGHIYDSFFSVTFAATGRAYTEREAQSLWEAWCSDDQPEDPWGWVFLKSDADAEIKFHSKGRCNMPQLGIPVGATLQSRRDPDTIVTVTGESSVQYDGVEMSLSGAGLKDAHKNGIMWASVNGLEWWKYNGQTLKSLQNQANTV